MPKRSVKSIVDFIIDLELNKLELNKEYEINELKKIISDIKKKCVTNFINYYKKPVLPLSPYLLYLNENQSNEDNWENLEQSEKIIFINKYKLLKEQYDSAMRRYNDYKERNHKVIYSIS